MEISGLSFTLEEHEVCERVLLLLRKKVPDYVSITSVSLDSDYLSLEGKVKKAGTRKFSISFRILRSRDGGELILKLKSAKVSNTWWVPMTSDFALVNAALARGIPDSPGVSYSWGDEQLQVSVGEIVKMKYGIDLHARIEKLDFSHGLSVVLA